MMRKDDPWRDSRVESERLYEEMMMKIRADLVESTTELEVVSTVPIKIKQQKNKKTK